MASTIRPVTNMLGTAGERIVKLLTFGVHVVVLDAPDSLTALSLTEAASTSCVMDEHRGHRGSHR